MLTYKQRYKPRTEREYTKSDLTVYDSAGNTALRGLKVYGKSEIVDGAIKSAGEGWATVDLGTLNWAYTIVDGQPCFGTQLTGVKKSISIYIALETYCAMYAPETWYENRTNATADMTVAVSPYYDVISIRNSNYTDATDFKAAMSGVYLAYQLADPTQGNTIAIKTDNGTGIDGTMATFTTGTPLRGIPDTNVRDVMTWDGSSGEVTKNTRKIIIDNNSNVVLWDEGGAGAFYVGITVPQHQIAPPTDNDTPFNGLSNIPIMSRNALINSQTVALASNLTGINILFKIPSASTVEDAKAYLQNNPITLIYELATPTTQQLTQTENDSIASLRTFNGTTHFTNNATTDMTVNYTIKVPTI